MQEQIILVCEESFAGIMTAIYEAWILMNKNIDVHIQVGYQYNISLFTTYRNIETDYKKAEKVSKSIKNKISQDAYEMVFRASLHQSPYRGETIFNFLKVGYKIGPKVTDRFSDAAVMDLFELSRKVANEAHLFKGFVRFEDINGVLFSRIDPKSDVIELIAPHFNDRYPNEKWIIYDGVRRKSAVHQVGSTWIIVDGEIDIINQEHNDENYQKLWQIFFNAIAIESRENYECQRNLIPKWYRKNVIELQAMQHKKKGLS
ncbi:MAG: TIGR03915 family putative DNA repair protein [Eubacterium sp.]